MFFVWILLLSGCTSGPPPGSVLVADCPVEDLYLPPGSEYQKGVEMPNYWFYTGTVPTDEAGFVRYLATLSRSNGMHKLSQVSDANPIADKGIAYESRNKRYLMVFSYKALVQGGLITLNITPR